MKKKKTNWDAYFESQMENPGTRGLVEDELKALRVGVQLARLRQRQELSQTELAAKVGMSAPNISRIETQPARNLTLGTLVRVSKALDCEVSITLRPRRRSSRAPRAMKG